MLWGIPSMKGVLYTFLKLLLRNNALYFRFSRYTLDLVYFKTIYMRIH